MCTMSQTYSTDQEENKQLERKFKIIIKYSTLVKWMGYSSVDSSWCYKCHVIF